MEFEEVGFDVGGVLTVPTEDYVVCKIGNKFNLDLNTQNDIKNYIVKDESKFFIANNCTEFYNNVVEYVKNKYNILLDIKDLKKMYLTTILYKEMVLIIKELSKNYDIIIISNQTSDRTKVLRHYLEKKIGHKTFFHMFFSDEIKISKPNLDIHRYVLNQTGKPYVYLDDKIENIMNLEKLGIKGILHINPYESAKELDNILNTNLNFLLRM